jgi:hypothetical protein
MAQESDETLIEIVHWRHIGKAALPKCSIMSICLSNFPVQCASYLL